MRKRTANRASAGRRDPLGRTGHVQRVGRIVYHFVPLLRAHLDCRHRRVNRAMCFHGTRVNHTIDCLHATPCHVGG